MSTYEALKYNFVGSAITGIVAIEVGTILPWSNSTLPSGYLNCDGTAVSRSTYSALFAIIATDYGAGDGSSTFNLPDLRDKVPLGVSSSKAVASTGGAETVSSSGSISIGAITPAGNLSMSSITPAGNVGGSTGNATLSTGQLASHSHSNPTTKSNMSYSPHAPQTFQVVQMGSYYADNNAYVTGGAGSGQAHSHNMSANFSGSAVTPTGNFSGSAVTPTGNFSGSATSVVQPYVAVKFMIKT